MPRARSYRKRNFVQAFGNAASSYLAKRAKLRIGFKVGRSRTRTNTATKTGTESTPVTVQNDSVVDFRAKRRRGSYRRRKRAKRWRRRVSRVITSQYPNNRVLHQSVFRMQCPADKTDAASYQLYGGDGYRDPNINPCSDLRHMFVESLSGKAFGVGTATDRSTEFDFSLDEFATPSQSAELADPTIFFSKGVMESTFRNTGTNDCIVEVYQYVTRRSCPGTIDGTASTGPGLIHPVDAYAKGFVKMRPVESQTATSVNGNVIAGGPTLSFQDVGTTPFQSRLFTKFFKIVKRTRYRLAPGTEASFVHRFSKQFKLRPSQVRGKMALAGITNGFVYQMQGCPYVDAGGVAHLAAPSEITFTNIRHYNMQYYPGINNTGSLNATNDSLQAY